MWGESQDKAFQEVMVALISSQTLCAFNPTLRRNHYLLQMRTGSSLEAEATRRQGAASSGLHFESAIGHRDT